MVHTLRVLRGESGPILSALSVFATEPTLDWLRHLEKSAATGWTPQDAILRAEKVLTKGAHPAEITCHDLNHNCTYNRHPNILEKLMGVVRGTRPDEGNSSPGTKRKQETLGVPSRSTLPTENLTIEQQAGLSFLF